jgi:hypothetical protein
MAAQTPGGSGFEVFKNCCRAYLWRGASFLGGWNVELKGECRLDSAQKQKRILQELQNPLCVP